MTAGHGGVIDELHELFRPAFAPEPKGTGEEF
jgi:hypothetical protein